QPYIAANADIELKGGEASTAGRVTYRGGRDRARVTYTGSADVDGLNMIEATTGDPVVSWKSMHAETIRFGLAPDRLEIDEVKLTGLDGRLMIFKDKTLSVTKLMKPAGAPASPPAPSGPPPTNAPPASTPPPSGAPPATTDS